VTLAPRPGSVGSHPPLILTAHGSADPRSSATTHAVAAQIRCQRPGLDVRVAFCEQNTPNLRDVLAGLRGKSIVTPLLLADAYHARVDIPALIAESDSAAQQTNRQAGVLGEDDRLVQVMRERLSELGVARLDGGVGVLVVAVGSSHAEANARTERVAGALATGARWRTATAFATGPHPSLAEAADSLRARGARELVLAPWFLAPGRITDRLADYARHHDIPMARPLGAHHLVAATVLDRFDRALAARAAA
jgi:sirohydrochlorin ferrochelatase